MSDTPEEWTEEQNTMFVRLYRFLMANQYAVRHPRSPEIIQEHWQTICHNAAWSAAEFMDTDELTIIDSDTEEVLAQSPRGLNS
jgi:hypothetical protein